MKLSAGKAAIQVGKSVPTITRAINSNKLPAEKLEGGGYSIDQTDLLRVFPLVPPELSGSIATSKPNKVHLFCYVEIRLLREIIALKNEEIADLRSRLDTEWHERSRLLDCIIARNSSRTGV